MPKKSKEVEKVTVFGEEIEEQKGFDSENFIWGILLIIAGSILLLNTLGLVPWQVWENVRHFWPVLIILWGFQVIAGKGLLGSIVITFLTIIFLVTVALFALSQTNPELVTFLPAAFDSIFAYMKGAMK